MKIESGVFAAPHRAMFLGGTAQALLAMTFWSLQTGGNYAGLWPAPGWPLLEHVPGSVLHGLLLAGGVFPWFVFGFIFTAGPRWQGGRALLPAQFLPTFILMAGGWTLFWPGLLVPWLAAAGIGIAACGIIAGAHRVTVIARQPLPGSDHIVVVAMAVTLCAIGVGAGSVAVAGGNLAWGRLAIALLVWGFLVPVFVTVTHRMLPFFTGAVLRGYRGRQPLWALRLLVACSLCHGLLAFLELPQWTWPTDGAMAITAAFLAWSWRDSRVLSQPMLAVLHIAFAWLAPAMALFAVQSVIWRWSPAMLGQAPLHAVTLGFFASMVIGMVSRVTLGHSGRPVAADVALLTAFAAMQLAALLRVTAELPIPGGGLQLWVSTLAWLAGFGLWTMRYGPILWGVRADGGDK